MNLTSNQLVYTTSKSARDDLIEIERREFEISKRKNLKKISAEKRILSNKLYNPYFSIIVHGCEKKR